MSTREFIGKSVYQTAILCSPQCWLRECLEVFSTNIGPVTPETVLDNMRLIEDLSGVQSAPKEKSRLASAFDSCLACSHSGPEQRFISKSSNTPMGYIIRKPVPWTVTLC